MGRVDAAAEQPQLAHAVDDRAGVLVGVLEVGGDRQDLLLDEAADGVDQLVGEGGIGGHRVDRNDWP